MLKKQNSQFTKWNDLEWNWKQKMFFSDVMMYANKMCTPWRADFFTWNLQTKLFYNWSLALYFFVKKIQVNTPFCIWIWLYSLSLMFVTYNLLDWMIVSNCLQMHARQRILTNRSFKDGIETAMKWVVTIVARKLAKKLLIKCW